MQPTLPGRNGPSHGWGAARVGKSWWLRGARLAVVLSVVWLLRLHQEGLRVTPGVPPPLEAVRYWFPEVAALGAVNPARQAWPVLSGAGEVMGQVLRTAPMTDGIIGYAGPTDLLIAEAPEGTVRGVTILESADTPDHVEAVARDVGFAAAFRDWQPRQEAVRKGAAVSGSTLTSLAMAEAVAARLGTATESLRFPAAVTLAEVQAIFPAAVAWDGRDVKEVSGKVLGQVLRTAPASDSVRGHAGPTESLMGVAPDGETVREVRVRKSYDTPDYVDQVQEDPRWLKQFAGRTLTQLAAMDFAKEGMEGVSGATETSYAVAEGVKRRAAEAIARRHQPPPAFPWQSRDALLAGVVVGALLLAFTHLRGYRYVRWAWQAGLIGYLGCVSHDLLSLGLLTGWAAHGGAWRGVPGLVLLGVAALFVPWATGRQVYCHQVCPHGAAQLWLGKLTSRKIAVPAGLNQWLEKLPGGLLLLGLAGAFAMVPVAVERLEPFDAWAWRSAGLAVLLLALAGLLASIFVPQAYCRYGCPTGALLKWVRHTGPADHWTRRDSAAVAFVLLAAAWVLGARWKPVTAAVTRAAVVAEVSLGQIAGRTMGTTWMLKVRDSVLPESVLREGIQARMDEVENLLSTWKEATPVSQFNAVLTTALQPLPQEILTLIRQGQKLASLTGGAYDLTAGPLVRAWGYGPPPRPASPPRPEEIASLRERVGWEKLAIFEDGVAKAHPRLEMDLNSLAEGWALDEAARWLREQGMGDFLLVVGGEIRCSGTWQVGLEVAAESFSLTSLSLSTSGTYRQSRVRERGRESHLIDARTGAPVAHATFSVSVIAADSLTADGWATALNVLGVDEGLPLADRLGLAARFVQEETPGHGRVIQSRAWAGAVGAAAGKEHLP